MALEDGNLRDRWAHLIAERDAAEAECERLRSEKAHLVEINAALRTRPDLAKRAPLVMALADERNRLRAAMVPMLAAHEALKQYLAAVRVGDAPAEGAVAVIAAAVDMMDRAVIEHGTIERQEGT